VLSEPIEVPDAGELRHDLWAERVEHADHVCGCFECERYWDDLDLAEQDALLSADQVCLLIGVSRPTLRKLREAGMPAMRVGSVWRFDRDAVMSWIISRAETAK
jgi:excisionase family DNA binding protein